MPKPKPSIRPRRDSRRRAQARRPRQSLLNLGCGPEETPVPAYFEGWRQIRVDVNPAVSPDLIASAIDLGGVRSGSIDAVWSSHCLEHLPVHEVPQALSEIRRVLRPSGFALIVVPDLQAIAAWIAEDRLHETIYESPAGPVTAHDMLWGFGAAIARGEHAMAHRSGFTPSLLVQRLQEARFSQILLRRRDTLELGALVTRRAIRRRQQCAALITRLGFGEP
jgi:SAM-dependent methyltransferase